MAIGLKPVTTCSPWLLAVAAAVVLVLCCSTIGSTSVSSDGKGTQYGTVVGIDLGTTYSSVGVFKDGRVEIIANDEGSRHIASCVAYTADGERLVGDAADSQLTANPQNTVYNIKRVVGRRYDEQSMWVDLKFHYPFSVVSYYSRPFVQLQVGRETKKFSAEEISAMILRRLKETAEAHLGRNVTHAVVSVPAYFNHAQRQATRDAGKIAGLNVLRLINEPTAAAIAYDHLVKKAGTRNVLVFDLGGGTFDVSLLTVDNGLLHVLATNGNTHLGGEDFNQRVVNYFTKLFKDKKRRDISSDQRAVQKLRREVEKAKRSLSTQLEAHVVVESLIKGVDFSEKLTRDKFEELNMDLFQSTLKSVQKVLEDARIGRQEVGEIILVGGSTRIPRIQQLIRDFFDGKEPNDDVNRDDAVVYGASVLAAALGGGVEAAAETVPVDVNALTLSVETLGADGMFQLLGRNTAIPVKRYKSFTTEKDYQTEVEIKVYEGEGSASRDNNLLGKFKLSDIPADVRGEAQVYVTFEVDADGILAVYVKDQESGGKKKKLVIDNDAGLLDVEVERKTKDAEQLAEEDRKQKQRIASRDELERYVYALKNQVNYPEKLGGKLSDEDRKAIDNEIDRVIRWLDRHQDADAENFQQYKQYLEQLFVGGKPKGDKPGDRRRHVNGEKRYEL